ncbi:MAG: fatty acid desaturase [Gammaproteobacteria bacterium]
MHRERSTKRRRLDLHTLSVALAIHVGFLLWTISFSALPLWLAAPLGSLLLAWYGSLQHETIHGHPTSSRRINTLIGSAPLSLWIPYAIYRESHIRHHRHSGRRLTEVGHDPESFYLPPGALAKTGGLRRLILLANCTLAGRLVLGPAIAITTFWIDAAREIRSSRRHRLIWLRHAFGVAAVLAWTVGVCHVPLLVYVLLVVYPSASITNLRSFAEHRANDDSPLRTNVVEASPFWSLLFLNNNLHVAHHDHPHVPWYELPSVWQRMRQGAPGAGLIFGGGYAEVCRKYLFRPFITPEHPFARVRPE